jgi:hypothetical protein
MRTVDSSSRRRLMRSHSSLFSHIGLVEHPVPQSLWVTLARPGQVNDPGRHDRPRVTIVPEFQPLNDLVKGRRHCCNIRRLEKVLIADKRKNGCHRWAPLLPLTPNPPLPPKRRAARRVPGLEQAQRVSC